MKAAERQYRKDRLVETAHIILPTVGFLAPVATFMLAVSSLDESVKLLGLGLVAVFSLFVCLYSFAGMRRTAVSDGHQTPFDPAAKTDAPLRDPEGLANDKAFYMFLESQLAECQRSRGGRRLSVLSIDTARTTAICETSQMSAAHLSAAQETIGKHLRRMDQFTRGEGNEFLVVLPAASETVARDVASRISASLHAVSNFDACARASCGWATFGADGQTSAELISAARERRRAASSPAPVP